MNLFEAILRKKYFYSFLQLARKLLFNKLNGIKKIIHSRANPGNFYIETESIEEIYKYFPKIYFLKVYSDVSSLEDAGLLKPIVKVNKLEKIEIGSIVKFKSGKSLKLATVRKIIDDQNILIELNDSLIPIPLEVPLNTLILINE